MDRLVNSEANARRIAAIDQCFGKAGEPLAIQGRVLLGEGVLMKICRKKSKPRKFFLFNDILVYGNIVIDNVKYNKQHVVKVEDLKVEDLADDEILQNGWRIYTPTKSFAVYAATAEEKTEWMTHITKCVSIMQLKTGKEPSSEHAAVWIPDSSAPRCMSCRNVEFTLLKRRHHCRKCGKVVCKDCSKQKLILPQSSSAVRVCIDCFSTHNFQLDKKNQYVFKSYPSDREDSDEEVEGRGDSSIDKKVPVEDLSILEEEPTRPSSKFYDYKAEPAEEPSGFVDQAQTSEAGASGYSGFVKDPISQDVFNIEGKDTVSFRRQCGQGE